MLALVLVLDLLRQIPNTVIVRLFFFLASCRSMSVERPDVDPPPAYQAGLNGSTAPAPDPALAGPAPVPAAPGSHSADNGED